MSTYNKTAKKLTLTDVSPDAIEADKQEYRHITMKVSENKDLTWIKPPKAQGMEIVFHHPYAHVTGRLKTVRGGLALPADVQKDLVSVNNQNPVFLSYAIRLKYAQATIEIDPMVEIQP